MELVEFFRTVITSEKGWFCLAHATIKDDEESTVKTWIEEFFSWPDELPNVISRIRELGDKKEIYFSPYLFSERQSTKNNAIVGRTIVADLDEANILTLQLRPTVLVETSPDRHQGYWILKEHIDAEEHETLSKRLTYSIPRCDRTGWFLGKKVRVPETYNNKYKVGPQYVRVADYNGRVYLNQELQEILSHEEIFGKNVSIQFNEEDLEWANKALEVDEGPQELLNKVKSLLPTVAAKYNLQSRDRSAALWSLTMSLFRAGLPKDKVFLLAYYSPNNKFKDLRYGGIKELAKDVLRAEIAIKIQIPDIKSKIADARKIGENHTERSEYITKCVREHLEKLGSFYHASDDTFWYIRDDTGRPIQITIRNSAFLHMLDNLFGINGSEKEATYVCHGIQAYIADMPITARVATLTLYEHEFRTFTFHTGRKDVLVVTKNGVTRQNNGFQGIIFPWHISSTSISPNYKALERSWDDELFEDCLNNVLTIKKEDAKAILKVWLLAVMLRDGLASRPILALFGQPGSGKSTLFRRVYTLMYGRERGLNTVTREDDFDFAMAKDALVVLDNVDTYSRWLPDRLAATISPTEITRRKLYTDNEIIVIRRQAMLGITAHNPKFGREDVTDRLLLLTFERLERFKPENVILDRISRLRNALWGAILSDIQKILGTDMPREGYPQFRIEDFAQFGYWIATALGVPEEFKRGIESIREEQKSFNLEEDAILLTAIDRLLAREPISDLTAGALWLKLRRVATDERSFDKKYTNAVSLGRKMWTLLDSLRETYHIEWQIRKGIRHWSIAKLAEEEVEVGTNEAATIS